MTLDHALLVSRRDPARAEVVDVAPGPLAAGAIRLRIDRFGLTTNNVTYAALGEAFHYNKFFPAPDSPQSDGWVGLPVWGLATVVESQAPAIAVGAGVYGFFPAAAYATLTPAHATPTGFAVERPHIPPEFAVYHQYHVADRDPFHAPGRDDAVVVFRPLFLTGLLLADRLVARDFEGADAVVVSSASSKTAYGVAAALRRGSATREVIGLSSARHRGFAERLGVYDRVLAYDDLAAIAPGTSIVHVDIAGGGKIRAALAERLGDGFKLDLGVGVTHGVGGPRPTVRHELFFAPAWLLRRVRERGPGFVGELVVGWHALLAGVEPHFHVARGVGAEATLAAHRALVAGETPPDVAHVLSL